MDYAVERFQTTTMPNLSCDPATVSPIMDNIILKPDRIKSHGLILLPYDDRPLFATVVAAGPGRFVWDDDSQKDVFFPTSVKPGDRVVFTDEAHFERKYEGETFLFVHDHHIVALIEEG